MSQAASSADPSSPRRVDAPREADHSRKFDAPRDVDHSRKIDAVRRPDASHAADAVPRADAVQPRADAVPRVDAVPREARPFQGHRAGIVTRTAANAVDFAVAVGVVGFGYATWCAVRFLINPARFSFPAPPFLVLLICFAITLFAYFTVSWATTGRTYGNHLLGLRVVNFRSERLRWPTALVRAAFCVALPIGLYWAVLSPTNRSLQDSVLRTTVLYDWTTRSGTTRRRQDLT